MNEIDFDTGPTKTPLTAQAFGAVGAQPTPVDTDAPLPVGIYVDGVLQDPLAPATVIPGLVYNRGFEKIALTTATAMALSPPPGSVYARVQAEAQPVRYRSDGTAGLPTSTEGMLMAAGTEWNTDVPLEPLRFIAAQTGAALNVWYRGTTPSPAPTPTPTPTPTKLFDFAVRSTSSAGRAPPVGCDRFFFQTALTPYSGATGVSVRRIGAGFPAAIDDKQGAGSEDYGDLTDTRLDGMAQIAYAERIEILGLPNSFVFHCGWSRADYAYSADLVIRGSDGALLHTLGPIGHSDTLVVDATGTARAVASFFALEQGIEITIPLADGIITLEGGPTTTVCPLNWFAGFTS